MMNLLAECSKANSTRRVLMMWAAVCPLVFLSGCRIPALRCAQPGPPLPETYPIFRPASWAQRPVDWLHSKTDKSGHDLEMVRTDALSDVNNSTTQSDATTEDVTLASHTEHNSPSETFPISDAFAGGEGPDLSPVSSDSNQGESQASVDVAAAVEQGNPMVDTSASWENSACLPWFQFFNDPQLGALISQAIAGNQELKILNEEIWIANNEVEARSGEYLPFVNLGTGVGIEKSSRFTREGAVEEALEVAPGKAFPEPLPDFLVAANLSWEIDIWRKLRNARDAAAFRFLATREGQNYVLTRLIAEVAESYYDLLALDNRLATLDLTIEIQEKSLKVAEVKKEAARGTELAVQRFRAEVRKNQSEKFLIEQEIIEVENRINFLLGRYPQPVERISTNFIDLNLNALSVGVPAHLLQNRPDIRQAERELAAAGLDVKVARARFYPSLDISAGLGYQAFNARYLFITPEALIYNAVGELVMPVINRRAIKAAYRSANAVQIQKVYEYQRTVLNAYTEVVNQMTKVENYGQSIEVKKEQLEALEASVDAANKLFQNARAEYVEVLLAQREMMEARLVLIETKRQQLSAIVNTYQALGGGSFASAP